jgi:divalent metal cation (Fe/Co/Zn/Cd) transporter
MADQAHKRLVSRAIAISAVSVALGVTVATLALAAAKVTGSPSLVGFGLAAAIDSFGSAVLIWYFRAHERGDLAVERREAFTLRAVGSVLILSGLYVGFRSIFLLTHRSVPERSALGVAISAVSVVVLPIVAAIKLSLAAKIPSVPLRSDGVLTAGSAVLAAASLVAVSLRGSSGLWWLDPAIALVIASILIGEGSRTLRTGV